MSAQPVLTSLQRVFMSLQLSKRSSLSPRQFLDILHPPWFDAVSSSPSSYTPWRRGIEEDIDKTITDVQRENCAWDDGRKTLLADNQGSHGSGVNSAVVERLFVFMATAWCRQCLVDSWSLPITIVQSHLTRDNQLNWPDPRHPQHKAGAVHAGPAQLAQLAQHNHHQDQAPAD